MFMEMDYDPEILDFTAWEQDDLRTGVASAAWEVEQRAAMLALIRPTACEIMQAERIMRADQQNSAALEFAEMAKSFSMVTPGTQKALAARFAAFNSEAGQAAAAITTALRDAVRDLYNASRRHGEWGDDVRPEIAAHCMEYIAFEFNLHRLAEERLPSASGQRHVVLYAPPKNDGPMVYIYGWHRQGGIIPGHRFGRKPSIGYDGKNAIPTGIGFSVLMWPNALDEQGVQMILECEARL